MLRALGVLFCSIGLGVSACSSAAPPAARAPKPAARAPAKPEVSAVRQRLIGLLQSVPDEGAVAEAVDPKSRKRLEALLENSNDARRTELLSTHPLLHVLMVGEADLALLALSTTDAAASELLSAAGGAQAASEEALLGTARGVARRAAAHWLRAQAERVNTGRKFDPGLLEPIDRVAEALGRSDIQLTVRKLVTEIRANALTFLALSASAARAGDLALALSALDSAEIRPEARQLGLEIAKMRALLAALDRAQKPDALAAPERLDLARKLVHFGLAARALPLINSDDPALSSNLVLATTAALAELNGDICPGLPPLVRHPVLCEIAWRTEPTVRAALDRLEKAWQSGNGRDKLAVVDYLGLANVIPSQYAQAKPTKDREQAARDFKARLGVLEQKLIDAKRSEPDFESLLLFVQVMRVGLEASPAAATAEPPKMAPSKQDETWARAQALASRVNDSAWARRAILAVASLLWSERDVEPLLALLPARLEALEARTRATLRRSGAVAFGRADASAQAETELTDLLLNRTFDTEERATLVLFLAESAAALSRSDKSYETLAKIGRQLSSKGGPLELRLRALVDTAGSLDRLRRTGQAREFLEAALTDIGSQPADVTDSPLYRLGEGYALVLRAELAEPEQRAKLEQEFVEKFLGRDAAPVPALIRAWFELWREGLALLDREQRCFGVDVCKKREAAMYRAKSTRILARLRPKSRQIAPHALAASSLSLTLQYTPEAGLLPIMGFEPLLLTVAFPEPAP